jgi:phosphatidylglycerol:prolipoprotein diacylglycerol transferase
LPRHPSQLYAAALEGALLLAYMQWRFWRSQAARDRPGQLSAEFLIVYAIVRVVAEAFREPDAPLVLGLSRGVFYSLFMLIAGVAILLARPGRARGVSV